MSLICVIIVITIDYLEIICSFKNKSEIVLSHFPAVIILGSAGGSADLFPDIIAGTGHSRWKFLFLVGGPNPHLN